ncbi:L-threonylcarbamoyladenylate synthase [Salirhabdus salicampi]|nr:L-threonylcarbamoyladenylate synthase [Salirhabdus salicampi]
MNTVSVEDPNIQEAAIALRKGEVVAFPTETVYGLGADATKYDAVQKIFSAKGRPSDNPLIVHIGDKNQISELALDIKKHAFKLMDTFWPGPLTIIVKEKRVCAENVTAGLNTVGIRIPDHPVALALLQASQLPVAAPSANRSGKPSPTTANHVLQDLSNRIFGVLDGGPTGIGVESTVIDCTEDIPVILRPGGITLEAIREVIGDVIYDSALYRDDQKPKSPGMKYAHYAPNAPLWIVEGGVETLQKQINELTERGKKVGVMVSDEHVPHISADIVQSCGSKAHLEEVASKLYDVLRSFDQLEADIILAEPFPYEGIGEAVMNRLLKAASHVVKL